MGYYENPPIINMNAGYDKLSQGILNMSQSIAQGLITAGERRREEEKEERLSLKKLQQQKNETDLLYNDKLSNWSEKNKVSNKEVDDKIRGLIQTKIAAAADARIALLNETNPSKRSLYLDTIRQADSFMNNAGKFAQTFAGETASYRDNLSPEAYGTPGGMVVNGSPDEIPHRTMALDVMSGTSQKYKSHSIDIEDLGDTFKLRIKAEGANGEQYENIVDASSYLASDEGGAGTYLQKVINNDEWVKTANKVFYDEKSDKILQKYLKQDVEKVKLTVLDKSGKDVGQYQLGEGQRLDEDGIKHELSKQAEIKASAFLKAGKEADLRAFVNCTLGKDVHYYDETFKTSPNKKEILTNLLVEDAWGKVTSNLHKTKEGDKTVYWDKDTKVEDRTIYNSNKGGKGGKGEESETATQKNQKAFNDRIRNVIKSKKGVVTKGGYTFGLKNGRWSVWDKYGDPVPGTEGITNPTELSSFIGGTLPTLP